MKTDERLSGALQENILCLLCFDDRNCKMVRAAITPQLFESSVFREVVGHAIDFIDAYGEAIKEHLPDHLESILKGDDARKADTYKRLVDNLFASRDAINSEYIVSQLHKFVRQQNLKSSLIKAVEALEDGRIDQAELEISKGLKHQTVAFDAGLDFSTLDAVSGVLDHTEEEGFELGIPELDEPGIIPRRKELYSFIAKKKAGKSWFLTHCMKRAMLSRWTPVLVTLEMGQNNYGARLIQSFFSVSRRKAEVDVSRFQKNNDGELINLLREKIVRPTLRDADYKTKMRPKIFREFGKRPPFKIKQFATGSLDIPGLNAYLDGLEREGVDIDVLMVDYPKLMKLNATNLRIELGATIEALRGIAIERNCAVIIVHQGNAEAEKASLVTGSMAGEDISIIATSDVVLTYSQTPQEHALGLARLYTSQVRNEESQVQILITQSYQLGQFCLDSVRIKSDYWDIVEDKSGKTPSERPRRGQDEDDRPRRRVRAD